MLQLTRLLYHGEQCPWGKHGQDLHQLLPDIRIVDQLACPIIIEQQHVPQEHIEIHHPFGKAFALHLTFGRRFFPDPAHVQLRQGQQELQGIIPEVQPAMLTELQSLSQAAIGQQGKFTGGLGIQLPFPEFLQQFCESDESLDGFIISTLAEDEPLRTPREQGAYGDRIWVAGYTREELKAEREETLRTTREKLLEGIPFWKEFAEKGAVSIVGIDEMLDEREDITLCKL